MNHQQISQYAYDRQRQPPINSLNSSQPSNIIHQQLGIHKEEIQQTILQDSHIDRVQQQSKIENSMDMNQFQPPLYTDEAYNNQNQQYLKSNTDNIDQYLPPLITDSRNNQDQPLTRNQGQDKQNTISNTVNIDQYQPPGLINTININQFQPPQNQQQAQLISANQYTGLLNSNIGIYRSEIALNHSNVFVNPNDNYELNQYSQKCEQLQLIMSQYLQYLKELEIKRQSIQYQYQYKKNELTASKSKILEYQQTTSLTKIFLAQVIPIIDQFSLLMRDFQSIIDLSPIKESTIPTNQFYIQNQNQMIECQTITDVHRTIKKALEEHRTNLHTSLAEIKRHWNTQLYNINNFKESYIRVEDYVSQTLTQHTQMLVQLQNIELKIVSKEMNNFLNGKEGIKYFYEKLLQVQGLLDELRHIRDQQLRTILVQLHDEQKYVEDLDKFLAKLMIHQQQLIKLKCILKLNQEQESFPLFQKLQMKLKNKNLELLHQIKNELDKLITEGIKLNSIYQHIPIYEEQKYVTIKLFNDYKKEFEQLFNQSRSLQLQLPLDQCRRLKSLFYSLQINYDFLIQSEGNIDQITTPCYIQFYTRKIKPKYDYKLNMTQISQDYIQLFSYQIDDEDLLIHVNSILTFNWPKFKWSNSIQQEQIGLQELRGKLMLIDETLQGYNQYSQELRFMRKLIKMKENLISAEQFIVKYISLRNEQLNDQLSIINVSQYRNIMLLECQVTQLQDIVIETNQYIHTMKMLEELNIIDRLTKILQFQNQLDQIEQQLIRFHDHLFQTQYPPYIHEEITILSQFIQHSLNHFPRDLDKAFCQTTTYAELEELLGGTVGFQKLRNINDHLHLRQELYRIFRQFFDKKITKDFESLFHLKLIQNQQGNNNFDPYKLACRTDLLYDIDRIDMNNEYVLKEIANVTHLLSNDQPQLRLLFKEGRKLFKFMTIQMKDINNAYDLQSVQNLIIEKQEYFQQQFDVQYQTLSQANIQLLDITPLLLFHQELRDYHNQRLQNQRIPLGIVLQDVYEEYLIECRKCLCRLWGGSCISLHQIDSVEDVSFVIDGQRQTLFTLMEDYFYQDYAAIIYLNRRMKLKIEGIEHVQINFMKISSDYIEIQN